MMADFNKFAPHLLQLEGGYVWHPEDKGGPTNKGITLRTYRQYCGQDRTIADLKEMSFGTWSKIMKDQYWDKCRADEITNQSVAEIVVDWCINSGPVGLRKVQEMLSLKPDGIVGPKTLVAINGANPQELFGRIKAARKQYFVDIVKRSPGQKAFMSGWMNRINSFIFE
ncbi:MAG: glycoside hydrolase family 108 protein [Candidatus Cryptobacteroides sp.]